MSRSPSDPAVIELNPHLAAAPGEERLVVALSARALFHLE